MREDFAADVIFAGDSGWIEFDVINPTAGQMHASSRDSPEQQIVCHHQINGGIDPFLSFREQLIQFFGLRHRAWEAVEEIAIGAVRRRKPFPDNADHDFVGYQLARLHHRRGSQSDFRPSRHRLAEHVARGKLHDTKIPHELLRLCSFTRPRGA